MQQDHQIETTADEVVVFKLWSESTRLSTRSRERLRWHSGKGENPYLRMCPVQLLEIKVGDVQAQLLLAEFTLGDGFQVGALKHRIGKSGHTLYLSE